MTGGPPKIRERLERELRGGVTTSAKSPARVEDHVEHATHWLDPRWVDVETLNDDASVDASPAVLPLGVVSSGLYDCHLVTPQSVQPGLETILQVWRGVVFKLRDQHRFQLGRREGESGRRQRLDEVFQGRCFTMAHFNSNSAHR